MSDAFIGKQQFEPKTLMRFRGTPSWTRLEPQSVTGDPRPGLEARVHDPLWLLCRQWQLGELEGDDAGSPLGVEVSASSSLFTRWQAGAWDVGNPQPVRELAEGLLLEPVVEDEPGSPQGPGLRDRAEAGAAFLARLEEAGFGGLRDAVLQHTAVLDTPSADRFDPSWAALVSLLAGRVVDGARLAAALDGAAGRPEGLPPWLSPAGADARRRVGRIAAAWRAWYAETAPAADADADAWVGDRLEYRFRVGAHADTGEVVLRAPEFVGGEVDWYSFDLDEPGATLGVPADPPTTMVRTVSATPLRFSGMPADRLWEFEDSAVNLGALQVEPHDLARLLLVEYAMSYGNDWLVVPLDVPFGSMTRISWVTYTTTFGERFLVEHPRSQRAQDSWRMFEVTTPEGEGLDALVVPPAVVAFAEGDAVEDVLFLRDENANLVWAVERAVEAPSGDTRARVDEHTDPQPTGPGPVGTAELDYLLQTAVPDHWIPYLPRTTGYRSLALVQGRMRRFQGREGEPPVPADGILVPPRGRLLGEPGSGVLADAEVPREGVRVRRVPVLARGVDGRYHRWTARRVGVGKGEGASGLGFDTAVPRKPSS